MSTDVVDLIGADSIIGKHVVLTRDMDNAVTASCLLEEVLPTIPSTNSQRRRGKKSGAGPAGDNSAVRNRLGQN